MDPDDTRETAGDTEETSATPPEATESTGEPLRATLSSGINRRKFLAAAALGSAAAALVSATGDSLGGIQLGPLSAFAHDLSSFQCTANDVRILGTGQVINEPCDCTGTFDATVAFTVENNAASERNCITLHLCPVTLPDGTTFDPGDVLLQGVIAGKTTQTMMAVIAKFPCGAGRLCFGAAIDEGRGRCDPGVCCSTVSWGVPGQDTCPPPRVISSKCRHQQICIVGRGVTTLDCNTSLAGIQTNCQVPCGATTTLRLCTTSDASLGPFTFTLDGQSFGPTADTCHDFTVGPITSTTTFTGTVKDASGCARSASVTLTTTALATPVLSAGTPDCSGVVTFTVTNCDPNLTFTFQEVDCTTGAAIGAPQSGLGKCSATFTFPPGATDTTHCVRVTASNGNAPCDKTAQASVLIRAAVTATLTVQGTPGCDGVVTLLATAGGGQAPFTFQFNGASGAVSGTGNTRTIVIQPQLNDACRSVTVTVTDARGCAATSAAVSFRQCVTTTFNC